MHPESLKKRIVRRGGSRTPTMSARPAPSSGVIGLWSAKRGPQHQRRAAMCRCVALTGHEVEGEGGVAERDDDGERKPENVGAAVLEDEKDQDVVAQVEHLSGRHTPQSARAMPATQKGAAQCRCWCRWARRRSRRPASSSSGRAANTHGQTTQNALVAVHPTRALTAYETVPLVIVVWLYTLFTATRQRMPSQRFADGARARK